jgi:hypothetical protein
MIRTTLCAGLLICLLALAGALNAAKKASVAEWPQWRGPNRDGISPETDLLDEWPKDGPPLLWKATGLGGSYSSLAIADGKIYTLGHRGGKEELLAHWMASTARSCGQHQPAGVQERVCAPPGRLALASGTRERAGSTDFRAE